MTLLESVAQQITKASGKVSDIVIEKLVQVEINNRVELITKAVKKFEEFNNHLKKINRPDVINFDAEGNEVRLTSANRKKDIDSQKDKISKLEAAIDNALGQNTVEAYKKLTEVYDKLGSNKETSKSESE